MKKTRPWLLAVLVVLAIGFYIAAKKIAHRFPRDGCISGTVTDEHGAPIRHARVWFRIRPASSDANGNEPQPTVHDTEWVTTDARGNYASEALRPGTYAIGAEHYAHLDAEERTVEVRPARTTSGTNFVMNQGEAIAGRVTDWDGDPVPGAEVSARTEREFDDRYSSAASAVTTEGPFYFRGAVVGDDGAFLLRGLEPGPHELCAYAARFFPFRKTCSAPAEGVTVKLRRLPRITGRVVDKRTGEPMEVFGVAHDDVPSATERHPDGRFEIILDSGEYTICISTPGYAIATVKNVRAIEGVEPDDLLIELVPGATLGFHVTSEETGQAIEGAALELERDWVASGFGEYPEARPLKLLSDAAGACSTDRFPPGPHVFTVSHPEFRPKRIVVEVGKDEPQKTVEVALGKGLTIRGRVVSKADGAPLAGARLRLLDAPGPSWRCPGDNGHFAETDESGAFKIERVVPGDYTLSVWHDDYAPFRENVHFDDSFETELLVEMSAYGRILVTLKTSDGAPAAGGGVSLQGGWRTADANDEGKCVIDRLEPGEHVLSAVGAHCPARESACVLVSPGQDTLVDIVFGDKAIFGTLTAGGRPVTDAHVYAISDAGLSGVTTQSDGRATTDEEGRYRIEGLRPGVYVVSPDDRTVTLGDEDVRLDIELDETDKGHIAGLLRMPNGRPAVDATIVLLPEFAGDDRQADLARSYYPWWDDTDEEGRFTVRNVPPGSYRLIPRKYGYAAPAVPIEKKAHSDISDLEITLQRDAVIAAHLRADHGEIPTDIWIAVCDEQGRIISAYPRQIDRETNTCLVSGLWPGRFTLVARAPGYAFSRGQADVTEGESTHLDLNLVKGHRLAVTVLNNSGTPLPAARVVPDSGDPISLAILLSEGMDETTDEKGRAILHHAADGDYTVRVFADGYAPATAPVRIAGADEQITITLTPTEPDAR